MNGLAAISGLSSGIQWRDLIDQIIAAESRPIQRLEERIARTQSRSRAWSDYAALVRDLHDASAALADGDAFRRYSTTVGGFAGPFAPLEAVAGPDAAPGTYQVRVLATATREKLGGRIFASRSEPLGIAGEFLVNGAAIVIGASDSLADIAARINAANAGAAPSGVTASVLSTGPNAYRLVLTADRTGAAGIDVRDGVAGALRSLGILDTETSIKHRTSAGARSDGFANATTAVAELLGLNAAPAPAAVTFGGVVVTIDLSSMSLEDVAGAINAAAADAGSGVRAAVVQELAEGRVVHRLEIDGTSEFEDTGAVLELLGILEGGRGAVAQRLRGGGLTAGGAAASAATTFAALDAGVAAGDTLTVAGTRADGSTFTLTYAVADPAAQTLGDFIAELNGPDGLGGSDRGATATIDAEGRIVVSDDQGGESRLALAIYANNEGGGALDFGEFSVEEVGRAREIMAGANAEFEIDGAYLTRSANRVDDVVDGLRLDLLAADPDTTLVIAVERDTAGVLEAIQSFADAYNGLVDFVRAQSAPPADGEPRRPLAGNGALRAMQSRLRAAMETRVAAGVAGPYTRLADIGLTIGRDGRYTVDTEKLESVLTTDAQNVARLLGAYGFGSDPALRFVGAGGATEAGSYAVEITRAAERAAVSGGSGPYVDDGSPDSLVIRDIASGAEYVVSLADGMTIDEIVAALNAEFDTVSTHKLEFSTSFTDGAGRPATEETTWAALRGDGGSDPGIAAGDVITYSGTRADGATFFGSYTVQDPAADTLGDLRAAIQSELGPDVIVAIEDGRLTAEARTPGPGRFSLAIGSDNAGGGSLDFGVVQVARVGRASAPITASSEGGQLRIQHDAYGAAAGFEVTLTANGADGTASLGLTPGTYIGVDVEGTIGGHAASGSGRRLRGAEGTAVDGLTLLYSGSAAGVVGTITYSGGVAAAIRDAADLLLGTETGSIQGVIDNLESSIDRVEDRIARAEGRLDHRRERLIRRFTAMEAALARAQSQSQWLGAQIAQL